jgi:DNA-directed RNA polymerase specialized sigma subunit
MSPEKPLKRMTPEQTSFPAWKEKPAKKPSLDEVYSHWKTNPTPDNMGALLETTKPIINSALTTYAGGNKAYHGQAKLLAVKAFHSYDDTKGTKLHTHLMTQMQPLMRTAREHNMPVYIPERVSIEGAQMRRATSELKDQLGREPSDKEIADHTGLSTKRIFHIRKFDRGDVAESGLTMRSEDGSEEQFHPSMETKDHNKIYLEYVHHDLDPIDQQIMEWKTGLYGHDVMSNNDIAKRLKLSPAAVSQRSAKIAGMVAEAQNTEGLK